jgi:hypothetical protein
MPDLVVILTALSAALALPALAKAVWHAVKLECGSRDGDRAKRR